MSRIAILGATGGIGRALTHILSDRDDALFLGARSEDPLSRLADEVGAGHQAVDATVADEVDAFLDAAREHMGGLDGVVHAVGTILLKPVHLMKDAEWDETLAVNLTSAFHVLRRATRLMRKEGGSIVLFSTAAARAGLPNHEAIAAAKAGVTGLARSAAATYASKGIRVNVVAPGLVDTPLAERITGNDRALEASKSMHALGRIGQPGDVARMAALLLHPDNAWITGQEFGVDGGLSTLQPGR